jgi:lysophospholipase L1-like esterase
LNLLSLSNAPLKQLKINFSKADSIPIYGFNFDDGVGVHVDNFSQRGNSGIPISKFDVSMMKAFQEQLQYNLIVLHYGTNVLNYGTKDYNWYDRSMTKTINRLKECFPGVAILVVSTADKSSKYDLEMKTDSAVVPLTLSQKRYALKTKSSYVNLYTLMGGDGSMVKWSEEEPAMANKDYTHFNFRGAKKVAKIIYDQLDEGYKQFKILRQKKKVNPPKKSLVDTIFSETETPAH